MHTLHFTAPMLLHVEAPCLKFLCKYCAAVQNGLDVPVGQCGAVNVTAYSFESAAEFPYTVSMHGGVSIWLSDKTAIPSILDNGAHYNW